MTHGRFVKFRVLEGPNQLVPHAAAVASRALDVRSVLLDADGNHGRVLLMLRRHTAGLVRRRHRRLAVLLALTLPFAGPHALLAAERVLGDFSAGTDGWERRAFQGETVYRLAEVEGVRALEAVADGSASALYRRVTIDLEKTPWLHWRWRVEGTFGPTVDERARRGDDYPARIYVVRRGGIAFWRTRALNYVWASARPVGDRWANAYAGDNVQMWAVDSGTGDAGSWVSHTRNVRADWRTAFGDDIVSLDGLALMTDADDTGGAARAWYADIRFSGSPESPWPAPTAGR